MSVADLFATQTAFNQRGLYQDTPESNQVWKTAFDIANNFGNTAETFRKHDENMATSAYRVGAMNAENKQKIDLSPWQTQASIAKAQYDTQTLPARAAYDVSRYGDWTVNENARREAQAAQYAWNTTNANAQSANTQAGLDLANWIGQYGLDPQTKNPIGNIDAIRLAYEQGLNISDPLVVAKLYANTQQQPKVNQSNQVDLRHKQQEFNKAYQNALEMGDDNVAQLNQEKFASEMARLSAVYGQNDPELVEFSNRVSQSLGLGVQPSNPNGQNAVPTGGIPMPAGTGQSGKTAQQVANEMAGSAPQTQTTESVTAEPAKPKVQPDQYGLIGSFSRRFNSEVQDIEQAVAYGTVSREQANASIAKRLEHYKAEQTKTAQNTQKALENYQVPTGLQPSMPNMPMPFIY